MVLVNPYSFDYCCCRSGFRFPMACRVDRYRISRSVLQIPFL